MSTKVPLSSGGAPPVPRKPGSAAAPAPEDFPQHYLLAHSRHVLLVDDDPALRTMTRAFLESEGYQVYSFGDPVRAVATLRDHLPLHLVVTDLQMPGMDGLQLAAIFASSRKVPVLVISGAMLTREQEGRIEASGWQFMAKPFSVPMLLDAVRGLLGLNSAEQFEQRRQA